MYTFRIERNITVMILNKIKYKARNILFDLIPLPKSSKDSSHKIIIFHGIDIEHNTKINSRFYSQKKFEELILSLQQYYHIIPTKNFILKNFIPGKPNLCIQFDDGYENNYSLIFPIVQKHHIPITIFVSPIQLINQDCLWPDLLDVATQSNNTSFEYHDITFKYHSKHGYINSQTGEKLKEYIKTKSWDEINEIVNVLPGKDFRIQKEYDLYWKLMTKTQLKSLSESPLVTIGSHSVTHQLMTNLNAEEAEYEFLKSKLYLEEVIQKPIHYFAYPFGEYNTSLVELAFKAGYTNQFIGIRNKNDESNKNIHERFIINPHISIKNQIRYILKGKYL